MAKLFDITKFNDILKKHNQLLYAIEINGKKVRLSNGVILTSEREVRLCKKRVITGHNVWKTNFDKLYSENKDIRAVAEKKCRSVTSKKGGINCWRKHSDKIKKNLNNGTPYIKGKKRKTPVWNAGLTKETNESLASFSRKRRGKGNPMFGKKQSIENKKKSSARMKQSILDGSFTPNSNNRNTHWDSFYNNKKYRSSWEALYQYYDPYAEYETLRIKYIFNEKECIYIVDFVNHISKTAIEVKPREMLNDAKTYAKINALKEWCKANGYKLLICDQQYLLEQPEPDLTQFSDLKTLSKIKKLYEIN